VRRCSVERVATAGAIAVLAAVGRRRHLTWGSTPDEVARALPGDELVRSPHLTSTRSITVRAAAGDVWPWLAQMGQGRGGLYSYDWLENLAGCQMHSADRVVPEWQSVEVGDPFRLHPDLALRVARIDPGESLVVEGGVSPTGQETSGSDAPYDFSWAFVLVPVGADATRLIIRERYRYHAAWVRLMVEPVSVISCVMTERMMRGIRDRAEGTRSGS